MTALRPIGGRVRNGRRRRRALQVGGGATLAAVAGVVLLASVGCGAAGDTGTATASPPVPGITATRADEGQAAMSVEVDLYSGRPNPHFVLRDATAGELTRRVEALEPIPPDELSEAPTADGLGYRGLRVQVGTNDTATSGSDAAKAVEIMVFDGIVTVSERGGGTRLLRDPGRGLEGWLAEAGAARLEPAVNAAVREDLARQPS